MIVKIPAILGCLFLTLAAVIIAVTGPAHGYEISIYNAYPAFFWLLILLSFGCGLVILVGQAFANESSKKWVTGFVILLLTNMLLFLLPFFREYVVYGRADVLTNIGYVKDILLTGHITAVGDQLVDIYPALHILAACVSDITMLSPEQVAILSVPLAVIFYMVSLYFLSRIVCRNRSQILLAISFGSLPLFTGAYVFFIPIDITFFLLPLTLLLFFRAYKGKTIRSRVALLIALISAVIFHPIEGAILTLVILTCFGISSNIYSVFLGKTKHKIATLNYWYLYVIILVVADAIWSFRFSVLTGTFHGWFQRFFLLQVKLYLPCILECSARCRCRFIMLSNSLCICTVKMLYSSHLRFFFRFKLSNWHGQSVTSRKVGLPFQ